VQYAGDSAERLVLAVVESALTVEMAKQLVGAVYQVDNHEELAALKAGYPTDASMCRHQSHAQRNATDDA
jgi:hypothetical protein